MSPVPETSNLNSDVTVSQRAKLSVKVLLIVSVFFAGVVISGCTGDGKMTPVYDPMTRDLIRLDYDVNGDGRIDVRTFMEHGTPVRLEGDQDGDGRLDRWEYYGPDGQLVKLGTSSHRDGIEDTWLYQSGTSRRIEISAARDGVVDRTEFYEGVQLVRVETDANHDGKVDHWEDYDQGNLRMLRMDDEQHPGRPVRRLTYRDEGEPLLEVDLDGDGVFQSVGR